jgi:TonB family protein
MKLHAGQKIGLRNLKSGREAESTVTSVETLLKDTHQVELQFVHPQTDFWPVQFPAEPSASPFHQTEEATLRTEPALISSSESLELDNARFARHSATPAANHPPSGTAKPEPLAASVTDSRPAFGATTTQFSNSVARDSVAQFRAANRAAYRRQQQLKFAYAAFALIAIFVAVVFGRPYWQQRSQIVTPSVDAEPVAVQRPHIRVQKPPAPVEKVPAIVAASVVEQPQPVAHEPAAPAPAPTVAPAEASFHPNAEDLARSEAEKNMPQEVSVRHGATVSERAPDDEPIAFPVKVAETASAGPATSTTIGDLVSHGAQPSAVLGSQPTKKVTPLKLISTVSAGYPPLARQYRVEGQVVIVAQIDKTGTVIGTKVLSGPPMLRESAAAAVRRWKYQPATLDDKPVPSTDTVTLSFKVH